jgi:hypothetical protein
VETNDTQNNQVITEQDDTRSTISCISQSNESDTDEMDMLAHSTIKQEENIDNDDNDNDDDDTPYVPNNSNNTNSTSPTPPSFHDSDNKQNETSSEQDIPDADSLQNTPTDTLYETEEAITPIATLPKNDYFSDMTQPNPVTHNTHWEPAYLTFMEQIDDNNNKKQDLLEPDYPDYPDYPDLASCLTEEEGILEFRGLSTEITRDDKNEWYDNYKSASSDKTIRSSVSSSCKQSNSTENTNYNQQTEEEHFDYYSTKLHTDQPAEDSGEITVYLDRSSLQEERRSNTDLQTLDFRNLSNISFNNNSNLTLSSSVSSTRSSVIADLTKPRIEDISYYMSTLPVFEKAAALIDDDQENQSSQRECANREARGIPSAHEIDYGTLPSDTLNSSDSLPKESGKGKLYIGIRGAHDMLLPIPNELTYARCVISDGKYEYISRFEILGREILLDYEAVIDTLPGTIITVSIQVRPDYHVMPRTGISKFFTSARKQKEQLSGYVYAADGSISQTRFSVDAMVPKCYKKTYQSNFDCFNSWYTRTSQERARDPEEMLKIVGKLTVEMLYLPLKDETAVSQILKKSGDSFFFFFFF